MSAHLRVGKTRQATKQGDLEIPRTARHSDLDLPIGSKEGSYDLALLNESWR